MMNCILMLVLVTADPMTPEDLDRALQVPPTGAEARALADRIRASFPREKDLAQGGHLVDCDAVAFVIAAADARPRVEGMVNHSRGLDLVPIATTGLWARVEPVPADTKFSYHFTIGGQQKGGAVVEMPGWSYPAESSEKPGVAYGRYEPLTFRSRVFGNDRTGWIYVPAAYDGKQSASLMVFQDGDAYKGERVGTVVENLIAARQMPVTILVLLNPGRNDDGTSNRSVEYDTLSDRYATFLSDEVLPLVAKSYALAPGADRHAIGGASSGGICAFTVAWHRPEQFGRVLSQIGSFTNIRGGDAYPDLVRREPARPIRVLLTDGTNDLINEHGNWWQANNAMYSALKEKGYAARFATDRGFHAYWTCGRQLPDALRWLWADEPK
jgi:enterochelin esterase family protein